MSDDDFEPDVDLVADIGPGDYSWNDAVFLVWIACAMLGFGAVLAFVLSLIS